MTNRRQLQYNIPFFLFFFFFLQSVQRKKTVTDPVKTQSDQMTFSLTASFSVLPCGSAPECTMYREGRLEFERGLDGGELHTSTATRLGSAVDIQLSRIKRTKTGTRFSELYPGTKFPPPLFFFSLNFHCILGSFKGQRSTRKKKRQG